MRNIIYLLLSSLIMMMSCSKSDMIPLNEESNDIDSTILVNEIRYLALGDSYTIGQGVSQSESWPYQLQQSLKENGDTINEIKIIAKTGWTTTNLLNAIDEERPENFNLVSLLIGVNNQFQGLSFEAFQSEFDSLIQTSIRLAGNKDRVFVVSIPDYGVTPFGSSNSAQIGRELDTYNNYMKLHSEALDIPFIDITEISRDLGGSDAALATDRLHPSGAQYSLWVEEILPVAIGLLK